MNFNPGDLLLISLIFSDQSASKRRPVMVVYDSGDNDLLVAPVTSQPSRTTFDVEVSQWENTGLRLPSMVRLEKLATVEKTLVIRHLGRLTAQNWVSVTTVMRQFFNAILCRSSLPNR